MANDHRDLALEVQIGIAALIIIIAKGLMDDVVNIKALADCEDVLLKIRQLKPSAVFYDEEVIQKLEVMKPVAIEKLQAEIERRRSTRSSNKS